MMLIIATQSPTAKPLPKATLNAALLLSQNAVITAAMPNSALDNFNQVFALESDLAARGLIKKAQLNEQIIIISLSKFVELTTTHHPIINW